MYRTPVIIGKISHDRAKRTPKQRVSCFDLKHYPAYYTALLNAVDYIRIRLLSGVNDFGELFLC